MTPGGKPASTESSPSRSAVRGVSSDGFRITQFPVARAGANLRHAMTSGAFQGMIEPTTPILETFERAQSTKITERKRDKKLLTVLRE